MKRKLISQEIIDNILNKSSYIAEKELKEASNVVAKALGLDNVSLYSFNESNVVYKNYDNDSYIFANYEIKNEDVLLENIEELVVDKKTVKAKAHSILGEMIDAICDDNKEAADQLFKDYLAMFEWKKSDSFESFKKKKKSTEDKERLTPPSKKKAEKETKESKKSKFLAMIGAAKANKDKKNETFIVLAKNVLEYIDFINNGPTYESVSTMVDEKHNIISVSMPNSKKRNVNKALHLGYKNIGNGLRNHRENALNVVANQNFCKAIAELREKHVLSEAKEFEEVIEKIVKAWPNALYVTQNELSNMIGEALINIGYKNYDDETCAFLAEAILRNSFETYTDRVNKILSFAKTQVNPESQDAYADFQETVEVLYEKLDEQFTIEKKVFSDLYEAFLDVYKTADKRNNEGLKVETSKYLQELQDVLQDQIRPDLELAKDAAEFLLSYVETNLNSEPWSVSNTPHITLSGDHPAMAEKAKKGYSPAADFSGEWGAPAPQIGADDMNYKSGKYAKETSDKSWMQEGGNEVFPHLSNPYMPKGGEFTMKGDKGVDKDTSNSYATYKSSDTWPNLQNPYQPKAETPKSYKMKNGSETDLVVDK